MVAAMSRAAAAGGAALAAAAVALGALGAHGLKETLRPEALGWWQTAVQYQMWNGLGLVALGAGSFGRVGAPALLLAGGAAVFCTTLYAMALGAPRWLGAVTPVGGALMVAGWSLLAYRLVTDRAGPPPS